MGCDDVDWISVVVQDSADESGGEAGIKYRGPELDYVAYVFVFLGSIIICRLYKLTFQTKLKSVCNWESGQDKIIFFAHQYKSRIKIFSRFFFCWAGGRGGKKVLGDVLGGSGSG